MLNTLLWPTQYICTYNTHSTQSYKERKNITKAVQLNTLNKAYYFVSVKKLFCVWSCPLLCMSHSSPINTFYRCVNWGLENLHSTASLWCLPNPIAWNDRNINSTSTEVVLEDDNCLIWKEYLVSNGWWVSFLENPLTNSLIRSSVWMPSGPWSHFLLPSSSLTCCLSISLLCCYLMFVLLSPLQWWLPVPSCLWVDQRTHVCFSPASIFQNLC